MNRVVVGGKSHHVLCLSFLGLGMNSALQTAIELESNATSSTAAVVAHGAAATATYDSEIGGLVGGTMKGIVGDARHRGRRQTRAHNSQGEEDPFMWSTEHPTMERGPSGNSSSVPGAMVVGKRGNAVKRFPEACRPRASSDAGMGEVEPSSYATCTALTNRAFSAVRTELDRLYPALDTGCVLCIGCTWRGLGGEGAGGRGGHMHTPRGCSFRSCLALLLVCSEAICAAT